MDFSCIKYRGIKCGSDLQTYKHNVSENLGLQISGISREQRLSMLVSIRAQHWHLHLTSGFVTYSTIHIICGCINAVGKIIHRIPVIHNQLEPETDLGLLQHYYHKELHLGCCSSPGSASGNLWFCRFKREYGCKFFTVSHSFGFWLSTRRR